MEPELTHFNRNWGGVTLNFSTSPREGPEVRISPLQEEVDLELPILRGGGAQTLPLGGQAARHQKEHTSVCRLCPRPLAAICVFLSPFFTHRQALFWRRSYAPGKLALSNTAACLDWLNKHTHQTRSHRRPTLQLNIGAACLDWLRYQ